ncbi:MAG TPA: hypothetical protein VMB21_12910 [Candidatus Limnocylindria bacterium]|jgi:hypothetical protein|nr:hypothetical protein [Candidatus Limnocylindria bacterium]
MTHATFKHLYCAKTGLQSEPALQHLFRQCIPLWKRPVMALIHWLDPSAFQLDWSVIQEAGEATSHTEVETAVDLLHYRGRRELSFWRDFLGFRISGKRLLELADQLMAREQISEEERLVALRQALAALDRPA